MSGGPSYEGMQAGQQAYAAIEFCRKAETLWAKIESGHWDWLGVKPDGQFVLGKPSVRRGRGSSVLSVGVPGADGSNRIDVRAPRGVAPTRHLFVTPEEAREAFSPVVSRLDKPDGSSALYRVDLHVAGVHERSELVVRTVRNYLGGGGKDLQQDAD